MSRQKLVGFHTSKQYPVAINPEHVTMLVYDDLRDVVRVFLVDGKQHEVPRPEQQHVKDSVNAVARKLGFRVVEESAGQE